MVINKRKKLSRYRASKTHGCGSMKKRRGAGNRGGRGNAGTGKRGDAKKPCIWKNSEYFGKRGFKIKGAKKINCATISYLNENCDGLLLNKKIKKENDFYVVDLNEMGFNKLLSKGKLTKKFKIKVESASKKVIETVKKSGGEVILANKK